MEPLRKRNNPFATQNEPVATEKTPTRRIVDEETYREPVKQQPRRVQQTYRQSIEDEDKDIRDKFTSTMDRRLRRIIKVYCAENGIMFAEFVEAACREKLRKEGVE